MNNSAKLTFSQAYLWSLIGKLLVRSIGLVSTLVLVRVLEPSDFGLYALGTAVMGMFFVFSEVGVKRYLIINQCNDPHILNAAWTIRVLLNGTMIGIIFVLSPLIADYFDQPKLEHLIKLLCLAELFLLFQNIGIVKYEIDLNYKPLEVLTLKAKVFSTVVCLTSAFVLKSFEALVYGYIANYFALFALSYFYSNHQVKFVFSFPKGLFKFSLNLMFRNIAGFLRAKIDVFIIGKLFTSAEVGKYTVSQEFAILPQTEIVSPTARPLFGLLSKNQSMEDKYEQTYKFMSVLYLFIIPAVVGVFVTADLIARVLLGDKWTGAGDIIGLLSVLMLPFTMQPLMNNLYDFNGKGFVSGIVDILSIVAISSGALLLHFQTLKDFSYFRFFIAFFTFSCILAFAKYFINIKIKRVLDALAVPTVSALIMGLVVSNTDFKLSPLFLLIAKALMGGMVYSLIFICLALVLRKSSPSAEWLSKTSKLALITYFKK